MFQIGLEEKHRMPYDQNAALKNQNIEKRETQST